MPRPVCIQTSIKIYMIYLVDRNRKSTDTELFPEHLSGQLRTFCKNFGFKPKQLCGTGAVPATLLAPRIEFFMTEQHAFAMKNAFGIDVPLGMTTIQVPSAELIAEAPSAMLRILTAKHGIPRQHQFEVYARILLAKTLADPVLRPWAVSIHLMATGVFSALPYFLPSSTVIRCFRSSYEAIFPNFCYNRTGGPQYCWRNRRCASDGNRRSSCGPSQCISMSHVICAVSIQVCCLISPTFVRFMRTDSIY